jgi:phage-related protein
MPTPILTLPTSFKASKKVSFPVSQLQLGDGYRVQWNATTNDSLEQWDISSPPMPVALAQSYLSQLNTFSGVTLFQWSPLDSIPLKVYSCGGWKANPALHGMWDISATFLEASQGECVAFAAYIDTALISTQLAAAKSWVATYTRDTKPMVANGQNVTVNAFHDVAGRRNYFPSSAGTSEGQATGILAAARAHLATNDAAWRTMAISLANAYISYFFIDAVPTNTNSIWIAHWLVNSKESFTAKGATAADYRNSGHFDLAITFASGVGQVPTGAPNYGNLLADVFLVYSASGKLLWRNLYAPLVSGTNYTISYWVDRDGVRVAPDGTRTTIGGDTPGTIVLSTNYSGSAKLVYTSYTGGTIAKNQGFDAFPLWRALRSNEKNMAFDSAFWSYTAFDLLYQITSDTTWQRARDATKYTTINTGTIQNLGYLFKRDTSPDPFIYPGTQLVSSNPNGATASRSGDLIRVDVAAQSSTFEPSGLQNFAVQIEFLSNVTISAEVGHSSTTIAAVEMITDTAFVPDPAKIYRADFLTAGGGTMVTKSFVAGDFINWANTLWYPRVAAAPIYTYSGGGGSSSVSFAQTTYQSVYSPVVASISLNKGAGFAGAGLVLLGTIPSSPPPIVYSASGSVNLVVRDSAGTAFTQGLASTSGFVTFAGGWAGFSDTPAAGAITSIEVVAVSGSSTVQIYYAGADPTRLPAPSRIYKTGVTSFDLTAHTLWVGNVQPQNNNANLIKYQPGVVPFTVNTVGTAIDAWRGSFYSGYQLITPIAYQWGRSDMVFNNLTFLRDAQDAYSRQSTNSIVGPFAPNFLPAYWDSGLLGAPNTWTWVGADPNTPWGGYQFRPLATVAEYWYLNNSDRLAQTVTMRFLGWLDTWFASGKTRPPTDFPAQANPYDGYDEPHFAALILRAALYANIAGGNPAITFRVLKKCLDFMNAQYVASGNMAGSWSAGQPVFTFSGQNYREYFGFWHFEIIDSLAILSQLKAQIVYPTCSTPL